MTMKSSQFQSVEGLEIVVTEWDCGCWHEQGYTSQGELVHLRFQACTTCWDAVGEYLDNLCVDKKTQLTLSLPSSGDAVIQK